MCRIQLQKWVKKCLEICAIEVGGVRRLMANAILNFHFVFWNLSLRLNQIIVVWKAMALQWIKDNIHSFKGDGDQVANLTSIVGQFGTRQFSTGVFCTRQSGTGQFGNVQFSTDIIYHYGYSFAAIHYLTIAIIIRSPCLENPLGQEQFPFIWSPQ